MNEIENKKDIKSKEKKDVFSFSVKFDENGDTFQNIMERIIISRLKKNNKND